MAPGKRKRADYEDSDDEEPSYGKQILPVAQLPDDYEAEPMDGMEYLFMVRRDAARLPHITRVDNPYELAPAPVHCPAGHTTLNRISLPSDEWRERFEVRIKNFRKNLQQPTIDVSLPATNGIKALFPEKKERLFWWFYLTGRPEEEWNPPKAPRRTAAERRLLSMGLIASSADPQVTRQESLQTVDEGEVERALCPDPSDSLPTPTGSPAPSKTMEIEVFSEVETFVDPTMPPEPKPDLLRDIDERMALHLLMYFTHWINIYLQTPNNKSRIVEAHGRWMFALLSKVGEQLSGDDVSLLRNLARACIALVKKLVTTPQSDETSEAFGLDVHEGETLSVRSCWIIVQTIVSVWAQRDLWMDAEDALKNIDIPTNPIAMVN